MSEISEKTVKCPIIYEKSLNISLYISIIVVCVITNKQRVFLQKLLDGDILKEDNPKKFSAVMLRIQEQIDKNMANLIWVIDNCPKILRDEDAELNDVDVERYRRFKAFAYVVAKLNPMTELEEVELPDILVKLARLYPKFYFKILRKETNVP